MKKIWLLTTILVAGLLLTGCNKTCTDDCWSEDLENHDQIQCGNVYDPICWEDWKVYSNWCYLNVAGAHWDETLWVKNNKCFKITKESLYWKYILTRYNDNHNVRDNHNIELNISADWIFAKFCNHLGTSNYSLSWNILTVEEMSQTEMACEWENWEWLMNAESEFNLNDARVTLSEDNLTISTSRWAQYQFQISDDYNQFLEAIKSSWEQPQGEKDMVLKLQDLSSNENIDGSLELETKDRIEKNVDIAINLNWIATEEREYYDENDSWSKKLAWITNEIKKDYPNLLNDRREYLVHFYNDERTQWYVRFLHTINCWFKNGKNRIIQTNKSILCFYLDWKITQIVYWNIDWLVNEQDLIERVEKFENKYTQEKKQLSENEEFADETIQYTYYYGADKLLYTYNLFFYEWPEDSRVMNNSWWTEYFIDNNWNVIK